MHGENWLVSKENSDKLKVIKDKFIKSGLWDKFELRKTITEDGEPTLGCKFDEEIFVLIEELAKLRHISKSEDESKDTVGIMAELFCALIFRNHYSLDEFFKQFEFGLREDKKTGHRLGDGGGVDLDINVDGEKRLIQVKGSDTTTGTRWGVEEAKLGKCTDWFFIRVNYQTRGCLFWTATKSVRLMKFWDKITLPDNFDWKDISRLPDSKTKDPWGEKFRIPFKASISTSLKKRGKKKNRSIKSKNIYVVKINLKPD